MAIRDRFTLRVPGALALALAPALASAQTPRGGTPACADEPLPFEATAANKLAGAQLQQAIAGKTLVYIRKSLRYPGMMVNNMREHRPDGSMVYSCEYRRGDAPWTPCKSIGSVERRVAGGRDVGVWSVKNGNLCSAKAAFGERTEDCFSIHRQGSLYAAKRVSGPLAVCMQGTITFK
jgi:hypothetical protein